MNFESLVGHINQVQDVLQAHVAHAMNLSLTGTSIVSYLQKNSQWMLEYGVLSIWQIASAKLEEWATLDQCSVCHRRPHAESLRNQIPFAIAIGRRYQAISAGEYFEREVQGIEGKGKCKGVINENTRI